MGKGSLDFATKVPGEQNAPPLLPPRPGDSSPNLLASAKRDVCCKRVNCITRFQAFNNNISFDKDNINERIDKL